MQPPRNSGRTHFKKGHSGNPGGRPRVIGEIRDLARELAPQAIQTLAAIMEDAGAPAAARVAAANAILDRGYGKPQQSVDVTTPKSLVDYTDEELLAILRRYQDDQEQPPSDDDDLSVH